MKKTISIALGGRTFLIEEDGYQVLDTYLTRLRTHFSEDTSVDELLADIESSIGEKFSERLGKGKEAITIHDVESVISIIGRVEEIADEDTPSQADPTASAETPSPSPTKRLYRNGDDRVIAGVCSGIAAYLGINPLIVRLLAVALIFVNGLGLIAYLVLWLAVPLAETTLQKLEMQGKPTNLNEFQELSREKETGAQTHSTLHRLLNLPVRIIGFVFDTLRRFFRVFGSVIAVVAGAAFLVFAFIFGTIGTMALVVLLTNINSRYITSDLPLTELAQNPFYYAGLGSVYLLVLIPLLFLAILGISLLRRKSQFRLAVSGVLIAFWVLAAGITAGAATNLAPWVYTQVQLQEQKSQSTRTIPLSSDIQQVSLANQLHLTIRQGSDTSLTFTGKAEELDRIQATTTQGLLSLTQLAKEKETKLCIGCFGRRPQGVLTLPVLTSFSGAEQSYAEIEGFATSTVLHITQRDGSFLRLDGSIDHLIAVLKGRSHLDADTLDARFVEIQAEDNSYARIAPTESLFATSTQNAFIFSKNAVLFGAQKEYQNGTIRIPNITHPQNRLNELP